MLDKTVGDNSGGVGIRNGTEGVICVYFWLSVLRLEVESRALKSFSFFVVLLTALRFGAQQCALHCTQTRGTLVPRVCVWIYKHQCH